ncbi:MAG: nucleotidyltransferase family protein, partial [Lachnospiraceae bacterium]
DVVNECKGNNKILIYNDEGLRINDYGIAIAVQTGRNEVEYVEYHGRKAVIEYVRMQHRLAGNNEKPLIRYHHIEAPKMDGTEVEVHFRVGFVNSPLRNRRMQRWFDNHADVCMKNKTHMGFAVPTSSVNVIYQMCHLFSHYFDEGLGLRQLMDYYFALRVWHNDVMECKDLQSQGMWSEGLGTPVMSKEKVISVLSSFGMAKFTAAVMYVLQEVFAMPTHYYICEPDKKEGRKLLAEIMQGGNFGQYDTRDAGLKKGGMMKHGVWKLKRVMRLVSSYPEEALWEPVFRVYHLLWRFIHR